MYQFDYSKKQSINALNLDFIKKYVVNKIASTKDKIFISSNGGIFYLHKRDIMKQTPKLFHLKIYKNYNENYSGANYVEYNNAEDKIYFNDKKILYAIANDKISQQSKVNTFIPKFYVNEKDYTSFLSIDSSISLAHDSTQLKIYFSTITPLLEYANSYNYKLEGYDKNWNTITASNYINYSNIRPGKYILYYKAICENGSESEIQKITIIIKPPFWQTWWFRVLLILLVILAIRWYFIYSKNKANEKLSIENEKLQTKNEIVELEQKLLLTQMNPHFIFNSLNSIKNFVQENNSKDASKYLSDFASLMRLILESSRKEFIFLDDEIKILDYYLALEKLRLNSSFEYSIIKDDETEENSEDIKILPMLLQPFIENAVKYGLENKATKGKILVSFKSINPNELLIEIEDNGIGIDKTIEIKNKKDTTHESFAMKITEERSKVFENKYKKTISIKIIDLKKINPQLTGTKISIVLPIID